jgi:hypothetical protein
VVSGFSFAVRTQKYDNNPTQFSTQVDWAHQKARLWQPWLVDPQARNLCGPTRKERLYRFFSFYGSKRKVKSYYLCGIVTQIKIN